MTKRDEVKDKISRLILKPWIEANPGDRSASEWLREVFAIDTRTLKYYKARKSGQFSGLYLERPLKPIQTGDWSFSPGDRFLVREDSDTPDKVHIQPISEKGRTGETVYEITFWQWRRLKLKLTEERR